jgi:hypothetical protein
MSAAIHANVHSALTDAVPVHDAERVTLLVVHELGAAHVVRRRRDDGACFVAACGVV